MISLMSGCADGALGMRGSPAWYMTASQAAIKELKKMVALEGQAVELQNRFLSVHHLQ